MVLNNLKVGRHCCSVRCDRMDDVLTLADRQEFLLKGGETLKHGKLLLADIQEELRMRRIRGKKKPTLV